jgi:hypothetical protein
MTNRTNMTIALTLAVGFVLATAQIAIANATNKSSYMYGHKQGKFEWENCTTPEADCNIGLDDCPIGPKLFYVNAVPHVVGVVTNVTACVNGYIDGWNKVCNQSAASEYTVLCPTTWRIETADTAVSHDYVLNGTTGKAIKSLPITWSIDKQALIQNGYDIGYRFGVDEWNQYGNDPRGHHFECPISVFDSRFCKGYDAAIKMENSDIANTRNSTQNNE